jgi:hypothetical protein
MDHPMLGAFAFVIFLFLPALISLFMAWALWFANTRPSIPRWRLSMFRWGLVSAMLAMLLLCSSFPHYVRTSMPAQGLWLVAFWAATVCWVFGFTAAMMGKGSGRIALACWGIFTFLGAFAINLSMIA